MSILTASQLTKSFGDFDLFRDLNLAIPGNGRIAIVGPNGIGKTTLLRILAGIDAPSKGQVSRARGLSLGYLPQEARLESSGTLWEACLEAVAHLRRMEEELQSLEAAMADPAQADSALERYAVLQPKFEHQGGYTYPTRIEQTLQGLGFNPVDYHRPVPQLSGGQRTRAVLAQLLLSAPDLLILDEPTNHLDIQAVEWLENTLSNWEGAVLIVSHDRYFLDRAANAIWEMSRGGIESYRGNYSHYLTQRQERWELRRKQFDAEIERLAKELVYIRRNISGQNVLQARGKLKRVSRLIQAIEQVGIQAVMDKSWGELSEEVTTTMSIMGVEEAEQRLKALRLPIEKPRPIRIRLSGGMRSGELVLRTYDLKVGYPGNPLFDVPNLELRRLETAALLGPNGAGKSTFLKTILEQLTPLAGEVRLGSSLKVGYFAQAHEGLIPENTLIEEIQLLMPGWLPGQVRDYLARFLFSGEDVFKRVSLLSGGERGRLALAKLALSDANLLLLDEPTNHLDIASQEVLQSTLAEYPGTILLVTHDRYLVDALATQIWMVDTAEQSLEIFEGTYSQYTEMRRERDGRSNVNATVSQERVAFQARNKQRNRSQAEERRRKQRLEEVEAAIHKLEAQLAALTRQLENPPTEPEAVERLGNNYLRTQTELETCMAEWESLHSLEEVAGG